MKLVLLLSSLLIISTNVESVTYPNAPSGIAYNGCGLKCTSKDYYLPGKGVWAPEPRYEGKSRIGAVLGSLASAILMRNNDPLVVGLATGGGLLLGYGIGSYLDKVDQIHASMVINQSLNNNAQGQTTTWNPNNNFAMSVTPQSSMNQCRKFNTTVQANGTIKIVNGIACRQSNGQWNLREVK